MKKALSLVLASFMVVMLVSLAFSQEKKPVKKAGPKPGAVLVEAVTVTAAVDAVDAAKRLVTLKMADGTLQTVKLGDAVKNFDQIKAGDQVEATFYESIAVFVVKSSEKPSVSEVEAVKVAPKGAKPGAVAFDVVEVTAKVESINYKKRTMALKGPEGNVKKVRVDKSVKNFKNIKKGDEVVMRITEAVAIKVTGTKK